MKLFGADFDNTIAYTFEPSPNGMSVPLAYELAVEDVLGPVALSVFQEQEGLQNRSPGELVDDLNAEVANILGDVGIKTIPNVSRDIQVNDLVEAKLRHMEGEIGLRMDDGSRWPRAVPGFRRAWEELHAMDDTDLAIISSGHTGFIYRTLELYGVEPPKIVITSDEVEAAVSSVPNAKRSKPNPFPMHMAAGEWYALHGKNPDGLLLMTPEGERTIYVGDDKDKDGGLAENIGAGFVLINPRVNDPDESGWRDAVEQVAAL